MWLARKIFAVAGLVESGRWKPVCCRLRSECELRNKRQQVEPIMKA